MNILLLGGGPAAGVLIVVMFCVRRIKKREKKRKKLADTSEPAANSIQTINNYKYEGNNMFWGKTLILQSFKILGVSACWNGLGGGNGGNENTAKKMFCKIKNSCLVIADLRSLQSF
jgi:hypothetical protein